MGNPTRIIINADDLGFSPQVNTAILCCAERGTVTAASVMVNMPFAESAFQQVQERVPLLSLALHFTLTSGKPISPPEEVPMLVDSNGLFHLGFPDLWYYLAKNIKSELLSQIQTELSAQLRRMDQLAEKYQCRFDHLDSHQHIHALPDIWKLLQKEAVQRRLPLRVPRERWGHFKRYRRSWTWFPQGVLKQAILSRCLRKVPQQIGYFGILETGRMGKSALSAIIQSVGQNALFDTYEINTHPSALTATCHQEEICCSGADKQFHTSPWREKEFQALNDDDIFRWTQQYGMPLVGFFDFQR